MTPRQICLRAACMVFDDKQRHTCFALEAAGATKSLIEEFKFLFATPGYGDYLSAIAVTREFGESRQREGRTLMLCFMAAILGYSDSAAHIHTGDRHGE